MRFSLNPFSKGPIEGEVESNAFDQAYQQAKGKYLIDVRSRGEFQEEKIPNAMNIDLMHPVFIDKIKNLDPEKSIFVYCQSGKRSRKALRKIKEAGYEKAFSLKGGLNDYEGRTV